MLTRKAVFIVIFSALIVIISAGVRQSFGVFLQPISQELGVGREIFSLAIALQNILFGLPVIALMADRFGSRWAILLGGLLYAAGLFFVSFTTRPAGLYLTFGLVIGLALSGTSYVVILGAVAQVVPTEKRSTTFGIITAAGSFGMFAVVPGAQWLLSNLGWQSAFQWLALLAGSIAAVGLAFPGKPAEDHPDNVEPSDSLPQILVKARQNSSYWLLNAGFFVCGFHVAFVATHLPAFLVDNGLSSMTGATALSLVGLFNMIGSYAFGYLGDRYRKKFLLSLLYFSRAVVISLFLLLPITKVSALIFGGAIGFLWLATVPLTSGMVAQIFGSRYLSTLFGIVFLSHQIGAFLGVWLGGRLYDATGSYNVVWVIAVLLGIIAALLHFPISEKAAIPRPPQPVTETVP